jgi:hypothetical protein
MPQNASSILNYLKINLPSNISAVPKLKDKLQFHIDQIILSLQKYPENELMNIESLTKMFQFRKYDN